MFDSDLADCFSRTHPAIVPLIHVPCAVVLLWYAIARVATPLGLVPVLFVAGAVTWTLVEYWLHRKLFHWLPRFRWGKLLHFLVHGVHHSWPRDRLRLVMPPVVSVTLSVAFFGLWLVTLGPRWAWAFHAGFVVGYMSYDLIHYYIHHFAPTTRFGKDLRRHHMLHHFKDPESRFGVSSPLWDWVFGTR
jgi:sterol desaturase/sphingolipid hydroxylase (fatty acid hydroxylase superfamily)